MWKWDKALQQSFEGIKNELTSATTLPTTTQVVLQSSQAMPLTLDLGQFLYSSKKTVPGSWCTMHQ